MDPKLSDPGAHFLEKSKSLPFHELPKDAPATLDAFQSGVKDIPEAPKVFPPSPAEREAEKYGTITFRDDSTTLADLKARSLSGNPLMALFQRKAERYPGFFRFISPKLAFWILVFVLIALLSGAGVWAANWYVRNVKVFPTLSVLPAAPDVALEVNINPDSKEYALLEKHASAFPGYGLLKKSLDPVGEGKTLSKVFQDSFKHFGLDFEGDIRPVLGESAFVIVSDMSPVGESFRKTSVALGQSVSQKISRLFSSAPRKIAFSGGSPPLSRPEVLGDMTVRGIENDFAPTKPLDFLVASPVQNREKALQTLEKMTKNPEFDIERKEFQGLSYFKVSLKSKERESAPDDLSRFVRFRTLYHALVGGNWVFGSSEEEMRRVLERQAARNAMELFMFEKPVATLADNADFRLVRDELGGPAISEALVIGYFNVASDSFFQKPSCSGNSCLDVPEWFRYPERIVLGWSLGFTETGIDARWTNKTESESLIGKPEGEKFSGLVPQKADGKWLNIFSENDGPKNRFYDFKRTRLTDTGREVWEEMRSNIQKATTIDIERDVIDHLSDSVAFSVLTAGSAEPEGVFVARVDDPQAVRAVIERIVEFVRGKFLEEKNILENRESGGVSDCFEYFGDGYKNLRACEISVGKRTQVEKERLEGIINSAHITETTTPEGTIYSFKLSSEFPYSLMSFDFGFKDNVLVLGTHFAAVQAFLREMGPGGTEKKLAHSDFYQKVRSDFSNASYQNSFVVLAGLWDVVRYGVDLISKNASLLGGEQQEGDDALFLMGSFLRTVKLIGNNTVSRNGFETSSSRLVIEPLPAEEKVRAERILEKMSSEISEMDSE